MADDDEISLGDDVNSGVSGKKGGAFGVFISKFLKWIIIAIAAVLVIVTVVWITVQTSLNSGSKKASSNSQYLSSEDYEGGKKEIYDWYTSLGMIQTQTCDEQPATVRVDIALGYTKDDKKTSTEITQQTIPIKDFLRKYFSSKTAAELRNSNNEDALKIEIRNGINDKILSESKIRDISFQTKDVVQQF